MRTSSDHRVRAFPEGARVGLEELADDPHPTLARLRALEPVSWVPALDGWLVTSYAAAVEVMRDAVSFTVDDPRFSTARVVGRSMLSTDGDEHRRHRAPFVAPFRPAQVEARFGARVERVAHDLLDAFAARGRADLRAELAGPLSVAVVAETLGLRSVDPQRVLGWYAGIVDATAGATPGAEIPASARAAVAELRDHLTASLTPTGPVTPGEATHPTPGSLLGTAARSLREPEVLADAAVMMFGGIETTEGMVATALWHLLREPGLAGAVRERPELAGAVVEESLRMEPAAAVVDRYATRPVELRGAPVAEGDLVRVSLSGANRDPTVFADPDRFDPARRNLRAQLSFARGPHVCVAMDLARLEARTALRVSLSRLPALRLASDEPADRPAGLVFRKPGHVRAAW